MCIFPTGSVSIYSPAEAASISLKSAYNGAASSSEEAASSRGGGQEVFSKSLSSVLRKNTNDECAWNANVDDPNRRRWHFTIGQRFSSFSLTDRRPGALFRHVRRKRSIFQPNVPHDFSPTVSSNET